MHLGGLLMQQSGYILICFQFSLMYPIYDTVNMLLLQIFIPKMYDLN